MEQAKISEIFLSYQGEGPFAGSRQLFVRFYGCNLKCVYCDTTLESYKTFTKEALLGKVFDFSDNFNELSLTGGEPLLSADFLKEFILLFKKHRNHDVYLETNGIMHRELKKIIDYVDIIAMDFKLPSTCGYEFSPWKDHEKFINIGAETNLIVKTVISGSTTIDDIKKMTKIVSKVDKEFMVVLQPVTPVNESISAADEEMIVFFREFVKKETNKDVRIIGQTHKFMGVR